MFAAAALGQLRTAGARADAAQEQALTAGARAAQARTRREAHHRFQDLLHDEVSSALRAVNNSSTRFVNSFSRPPSPVSFAPPVWARATSSATSPSSAAPAPLTAAFPASVSLVTSVIRDVVVDGAHGQEVEDAQDSKAGGWLGRWRS
ncbi:hypothetical protein OHQ89_10060 [Streptomyces canus]|uniref:hypothetical protein n=1 Tax=Streptomyces canus TaxID=58343 RepID=UPI0030DFD67E